MPQVLKQVACSLAGLAPASLNRLLQRFTAQRTLFPFYHLVSDEPVAHIRYLYRIRTVKEFRRDLDWMLRYYRPADPAFMLRGTGFPDGFLLSFDDGLREVHDVVLPVLQEKGIQAVCFVNPAFVGNHDLFYRYKAGLLIDRLTRHSVSVAVTGEITTTLARWGFTAPSLTRALFQVDYARRSVLDEVASLTGTDFSDYLTRVRPYMDQAQVEACLRAGMLIGAHSLDHPKFSELSLNEQLYQAQESVRQVQRLFGLPYGLFAFPFTDDGVTKAFFTRLFEDTDPQVSLTFGCAGLKHDTMPHNIQRIAMESGNFTAKEVINGEYLYYLAKACAGRNTLLRR